MFTAEYYKNVMDLANEREQSKIDEANSILTIKETLQLLHKTIYNMANKGFGYMVVQHKLTYKTKYSIQNPQLYRSLVGHQDKIIETLKKDSGLTILYKTCHEGPKRDYMIFRIDWT